MKKAICLLSGGLDSVTTLYYALEQGYQVHCLTVHYGQIHDKELEYAKWHCEKKGLEHHLIPLTLPWKGSALLDESIEIPVGREEQEMSQEIPVTYVPARNTIFLSLAASYAEAKQAEAIFIGANALDYSGYPDCRPEYFESLQETIQKGTKAGVEGQQMEIKAPLLKLRKKEIIELGQQLQVPYEKTWSCYKGQEEPCGECDSCKLRAKGFKEVGIADPLLGHEVSRY